jgi:ribose transport system substrate-binding protein
MERNVSRRRFVRVGAAGVGALAIGGFRVRGISAAPPPLEQKESYRVAFAQVEENNPWRIAQTESMRSEAERLGHELIYSNAESSEARQIANVDQAIAQRVDLIFLAPRSETPLAQAVLRAKAANIPVICLDRDVDNEVAKVGEDYICFIGSDFVQEGARAAEWLASAMNGEAEIIELQGTNGSSPAIDRGRGFADFLAGTYRPTTGAATSGTPTPSTPAAPPAGGFPGMRIVASQDGDFSRDQGRQVFETLYQANQSANAVYAHNDEMAIGAIQALEAQGRVPGQDVIIVSVDGSREALQNIVDGKLGATVECNPRFGPIAFETLERYAAGEQIAPQIINEDRFFDASNASQFIDEAY